MAPLRTLPILLLSLTLTLALSFSSPTVHDLLNKKGLPPGLLPKEVKSFQYDEDTGLLEVFLEGPCLAKFENRVQFESQVRANLSYGELKGVVGLTQEELFIWLPIKEISVRNPKSGIILFDIGMAQKQFSVSLFEDPPSCKPQPDQGYISYGGARNEKGVEDE